MIKALNSERAPQLQFLRFIAFLMIFFWHAQYWLPSWDLRQNTATSMVSFFFVLSGVVKGYSSLFKEQQLNLKIYTSNFKSRLLKVYPLYLITMLCSISLSPVVVYLSEKNFSALKESVIQFIKDVFLIQSWFQTGYFSFNGVAWFLSTLMFLFLFTDPAVYLFRKVFYSSRGVYKLLIVLVFIVVSITIYNYSVHTLNQQFWAYVFPPARIGEYLGGIIVGMLTKYASKKDCKTGVFTALEFFALLIWICAMFIPLDTFGTRIANWIFPNFFGLFIFTMGKGLFSRLFSAKPLVALGDISFECFLIHQLVLMTYNASVPIIEYNLYTNIFSLVFCLTETILLSFAANRIMQRKK